MMEPSRVPGSCGTILSHENPGGGTLPLSGSGSGTRETLHGGGTLQRRPAIRKKDYVRSRIKCCPGSRWLLEDPMPGNRTAQGHTSRRTQSWLSDNFCEHITPNIWPPNSPDCTPLIIMC